MNRRSSMHVAIVGMSVAAATLLLSAPVARAHHSFSMFDLTQERTITGTIVAFQWSNPHSWTWLMVPTPEGSGEQWGVEGQSPNFLGRRGWTKNTLKPGDKVSILIHPLRNGEKGGSFMKITFSDGRVMTMSGGGTTPQVRPTP
ncbi:MAG: DUF6152 family protein [Steroidobacteraceae bacterium]